MSRSTSSAIAYDQQPEREATPVPGAATRERREVRALLPWSTPLNRGYALTVMLVVAGLMFVFVYLV